MKQYLKKFNPQLDNKEQKKMIKKTFNSHEKHDTFMWAWLIHLIVAIHPDVLAKADFFLMAS